MTDTDPAVERAADELYGTTPEHFVERRGQLAKALRKQGDRSAADAVKALRKPNQTAWALNQVARRRAGDVERLLEAGAGLRRAQEAVLSGDDPGALAAAGEEERRVVSDLVVAASAIAAECGVGSTDSLRARVRSTLEAAVRDAEVGATLRAGRLVGDHQAVGLLDLSAWRPSPEDSARRRAPAEKRAGPRTREGQRPKSEASAKRRQAAAEKRAREREAAERAGLIEEAERRLMAARQRQGSAEERLEAAARTVEDAKKQVEQAIAEAEHAEETHRALRTELEGAEEDVRGLEEELKRAEHGTG